jgi:hypothetical protein
LTRGSDLAHDIFGGNYPSGKSPDIGAYEFSITREKSASSPGE